MTEKTDRARIEELEIRCEVLRILFTSLQAAVQEGMPFLACLEKATELHDATSLYATLLSDDQRHAVLERLSAISQASKAPPPQA